MSQQSELWKRPCYALVPQLWLFRQISRRDLRPQIGICLHFLLDGDVQESSLRDIWAIADRGTETGDTAIERSCPATKLENKVNLVESDLPFTRLFVSIVPKRKKEVDCNAHVFFFARRHPTQDNFGVRRLGLSDTLIHAARYSRTTSRRRRN